MIPISQLNDREKRGKWEAYLNACYDDRRFYIQEHLKIRTVDKRVVTLKLNEAQERLFKLVERQEREERPVRIVGVKPRKVGLSTGIQSIFFHIAATHPLTKALTVAHDLDATEEMFQMAKLFFDELPEPIKPMTHYSNRKELVFSNPDERARAKQPGLRSQLRIATAGDPDLGRSKDVHLLHCSEIGHWPNYQESLLSVLNSVPDIPETMVFQEGTPHGWGSLFHKDYLAARDGNGAYVAYFMAWHEFKSYQMPLSVSREEFLDSLTSEEKEMAKAYSLTPEQLNWRRWAIENKCGRDIDKFRQEYPANDSEGWLLSGRPRFDQKKLQKMLLAAVDPSFHGYLTPVGNILSVKPEANDKGYVRIWTLPKIRRRYCIGADVAAGLAKGDFSCGHVYDWDTMELCAEWHGHIEPDLFADELGKLGGLYGKALIAVEDNNHGGTTNAALARRLNYPHLYYRQELDDRVKRRVPKLGWQTNTATRPVMIDDLAGLIREGFICPSKQTIEELMSFVVKPDGKAEAEESCFDDRVIASAIAVQAHKNGISRYYPKPT